ncbi:DUF1642 domain-containing protein [Enterococcus faecium]|uniref:DUF1642 domain-containing protein n=1 Tax=Enterococcus faecium TaxID=1352 RepID=UPI002091035D|nr:DUF1642 domain-containing protein [Enterococcus faecium]MCO5426592.1 DUF1642 domain-containing protein [Enterococcus faecium]MCO5520743.1 DUF1642 domain-containing protein [Enterococcus faecium]
MNKQEAIKKLESIKVIGNDAIAVCYNESINVGITLMKKIDEPQITDEQAWNKIAESYPESAQSLRNTLDNVVFGKAGEPQKPVIQKFVADLVDWTNKMQCAPSDVIRDLHDNGDLANLPRDLELDKLSEYFEKAYCRYDFEKACFVGYEVEKEPLYHVKLTIPGATYYLIQTFLMPGYTHMSFSAATERYGAKWKNTFTESEIKAIDERYWAFAVPVEEAEA